MTDRQTGLQWEKKDTTCPGQHCVDDIFAWTSSGLFPDGPAFTTFLSTMNQGPTGIGSCSTNDPNTQTGGFAGYCDWRLPTSAELQTIFATCPGGASPCVDPIFGPTVANAYWSASAFTTSPGNAWFVNFAYPDVFAIDKHSTLKVRAVRGGQ